MLIFLVNIAKKNLKFNFSIMRHEFIAVVVIGSKAKENEREIKKTKDSQNLS